jgi:hypothetical protein
MNKFKKSCSQRKANNETVKKRNSQGWTLQQIADELGLSRQRVHQIGCQCGLKWNPKRRWPKMRYWVGKGLSNKEVALMMNCPTWMIADAIQSMPDKDQLLKKRRLGRSKPGAHWLKLAAVKKARDFL